MPIKRLFHQIWLNFDNYTPDKITYKTGDFLIDKPPPAKYEQVCNTWKLFHPGAQFILWNDSMAWKFICEYFPQWKKRWRTYKQPIYRCDVLRVMILLKFGGVYADMDASCCQNLDRYLEKYNLLLFRGLLNAISNCIMAASTEHPFMNFLLNAMQKSYKGIWHMAVSGVGPLMATGPGLVTKCYKTFMRQYPSFKSSTVIIPKTAILTDETQTPNSRHLVAHFGHSTWVTNKGVIMDVVRGTAICVVVVSLILSLPFITPLFRPFFAKNAKNTKTTAKLVQSS